MLSISISNGEEFLTLSIATGLDGWGPFAGDINIEGEEPLLTISISGGGEGLLPTLSILKGGGQLV